MTGKKLAGPLKTEIDRRIPPKLWTEAHHRELYALHDNFSITARKNAARGLHTPRARPAHPLRKACAKAAQL